MVLENIVDDLLITLNLPEWPAAEIVLQSLHSTLAAVAAKTTENATIRGCFVELIGKILAKLKQEINLSSESRTSLFTATTTTAAKVPICHEGIPPSGKPSDEEEDSSCMCGKGYSGEFMLDCDECHKWFHGTCVGVDSCNPPETWFCSLCTIRKKLLAQRATTVKSKVRLSPPFSHSGPSCFHGRQYHAASSIELPAIPIQIRLRTPFRSSIFYFTVVRGRAWQQFLQPRLLPGTAER